MGQWNHSIKTAIAGLSLMVLMIAGCQKQAAEQGQGAPVAKETKTTQVVATTKNGPITIEDIRLYQQALGIDALGAAAPKSITTKTSGVLEAAKWIATVEAASAAMKTDAPTSMTQQANAYLDQSIGQMVTKYLVSKYVDEKLDPVSDAALNKYYNDHKDEFRIPFRFRMRHMILTTYEPYTVGPEDTLESIAERISGSKEKASLIRADVIGRPLRREAGKEFKPLVVGEKLLVPMSDDKAEEVHQKLVKILGELKQGKSFEDIAKKNSEAGIGGEISEWMPTGTNEPQILPEIEKAGRETKVGEVSAPFRTRHGWQAIQVVEKQEEGYSPLSAVQFSIVQKMQEKQREQLTEQMYDMLMSQKVATIHYDRFTTDSTKIGMDTIMAEADTGTTPTRVRWHAIQQRWEKGGHPTDQAGIRRVLQSEVPFIQALIENWAKPQLSDSESELGQLLSHFKKGGLGVLWLRQQAIQTAHHEITENDFKEYYQKNSEQFRAPATVKITILENRLGGAEQKLKDPISRQDAMNRHLQYIREDLASVKTPAEFRTAASTSRVLIEGDRPLGGQTIELIPDSLPEPIRGRIDKLQPGQWTEPFALDDRSAVSIMLDERNPAGVQPYEKVRQQIQADMTKARFEITIKKLQEEYLKKSGFQSQLAG
ncbi:peptidyl-prolyl cis-trans isomerase [bacterium]|nr:peptidyl-prolyl cis-trans isomerase [bacterium]